MKKSRIISMLVAVSLLLSACGGSENKVEEAESNNNAIFKEEADVYSLEEGDISQIAVVGDTLYVEQYLYNYNMPQERAEETAVVREQPVYRDYTVL